MSTERRKSAQQRPGYGHFHIGAWDAASGRFTLTIDSQYPHRVRDLLAHEILRMPPDKLRVVSEDVGGAFGAKGWASLEHRHVLWLARKLGRLVLPM